MEIVELDIEAQRPALGREPFKRRDEPIGFWGFTRLGAPFALMSLTVSSLYVWLRYFAF